MLLTRKIQFTTTANTRAIEVTAGNTLTLGTAFDLNGTTGVAAGLQKNDNGTLVLSVANPGWTGAVSVTAGVVQITNATALGATANVITLANSTGAAVQIAGGITVANPIVLNATTSALGTGINNSGALESVSGANTWSGLISLGASGSTSFSDAWIGADAGSSLSITGGITELAGQVHQIYFAGAGNITVSANNLGSGSGVLWYGVDKYGSGTTTVQVPIANIQTAGLNVYAGTFILSGNGILGNGTTNAVSVYEGTTSSTESSAHRS